jgi:hypothetical protein
MTFIVTNRRHSTCALSIVRIQFLHLTEDFTWENVESSLWSVGELCCGVTCACLPTLRPLVARYIPALSSRGGQSVPTTYRRYGASSSRSYEEKSRATRGAADSSNDSLYKADSYPRGAVADGRWRNAEQGSVATRIVADLAEPKPSRSKSGRQIQVQREIRIVQTDSSRGRY